MDSGAIKIESLQPKWQENINIIVDDKYECYKKGVIDIVKATFEHLHYKGVGAKMIAITQDPVATMKIFNIPLERERIPGCYILPGIIGTLRNEPGVIHLDPEYIIKYAAPLLNNGAPIENIILTVGAHEAAEHVWWMRRGKRKYGSLTEEVIKIFDSPEQHAKHIREQFANNTARFVVREMTGWTLYHPYETPPTPGIFAYPPGKIPVTTT